VTDRRTREDRPRSGSRVRRTGETNTAIAVNIGEPGTVNAISSKQDIEIIQRGGKTRVVRRKGDARK